MLDPSVYEPYFPQTKQICLASFAAPQEEGLAALLQRLLSQEGMPTHCPVHHYIVPAALLTVCRKRQGESVDLLEAELTEAMTRARNVPGGFCGFYGTCGAAVGLGIFWSIITGTTPLSAQTWSFGNRASGEALLKLAEYGGPRCCKRVSWLTVSGAIDRINEVFDLHLPALDEMTCSFYKSNGECLKDHCPYYPKETVK
ncbi:MAG: hypothetical protein K6B40_05725 [Firmicutes bacterium]|nr:hypothetical protein [Bacillota bacterium]